MDTQKDYYSILGVDPSADQEAIKKGYLKASQENHPDKVQHLAIEFRDLAKRKMKEINEANEILSDPKLRATYDTRRAKSKGNAPPPPPPPEPSPPPHPRSDPKPTPAPFNFGLTKWLGILAIVVLGLWFSFGPSGCLRSFLPTAVPSQSIAAVTETRIPTAALVESSQTNTAVPPTRLITKTRFVTPTDTPISVPATKILPTSTLRPQVTSSATATRPAHTLTSTPTSTPDVDGLFANLWSKYSDRLGRPLAGNQSDRTFPGGTFGEMPFDKGHMFFFKLPYKRIWVVLGSQVDGWTGNGTWVEYKDTWKEGDPEYSCPQEADYPSQPKQGFGLIWCNNRQLGWGKRPMRDYDSEGNNFGIYRFQQFENGFIFRDSDGWTYHLAYVFFNNGEFTREPY